jgi:hypothetical protein
MPAQTIFGEWGYKNPDSYRIQNQELIKVPRITIVTSSLTKVVILKKLYYQS